MDWTTRTDHWHVHTLANHQHDADLKEMIVVLRDPVQRWISGFAQYACGWVINASGFFDTTTGPGPEFQRKTGREFVENYNWVAERLIFDNLETFDDHVWPQTAFLQNLLPDVPRRYFLLDRDFERKFAQYLDLPVPSPNLDRNVGDSDPEMRQIQQFLRLRINQVPELLEAIRRAYHQDYDMINSLQCQ